MVNGQSFIIEKTLRINIYIYKYQESEFIKNEK